MKTFLQKFLVVGASVCFFSVAHGFDLRDEAIKNLGSSAAYMALCEKENFAVQPQTSKLMIAVMKAVSTQTYDAVREQYQKSLHEKKLYSIAKDKWYAMRISKTDCADIEKVIPTITNHYDELRRNFPKR
jgi:hypothetical protein